MCITQPQSDGRHCAGVLMLLCGCICTTGVHHHTMAIAAWLSDGALVSSCFVRLSKSTVVGRISKKRLYKRYLIIAGIRRNPYNGETRVIQESHVLMEMMKKQLRES